MNTFNHLFRKGFFESTILMAMRKPRPKVSPKTVAKRKEAKRTRHMNKYSQETSGEKPLHIWMDQKKIKAIGMAYQEMRNLHRFTRNLDPKDIPEIKEKSEKFSEIFYHRWRADEIMMEKGVQNRELARQEAQKLPYFLREELNNHYDKHKITLNIPEEHNFLNLYYDQLMRILPDEMAERIQLGLRLQNIALDSLPLGE